LGRTLPSSACSSTTRPPLEKTAFSACGAAGFAERLRELDAAPVILTGVEAHVCVLLTALDLLGRGVRVSVVADAVCSGARRAWISAWRRRVRRAAVITSTETVVFQLLRRFGHRSLPRDQQAAEVSAPRGAPSAGGFGGPFRAPITKAGRAAGCSV